MKHIACLFLMLVLCSGSYAGCNVRDAEPFYREFLSEALQISSAEDTRTYAFLSKRVVGILDDIMPYYTQEHFSPEEIERVPVLKNKFPVRQRLGKLVLKGDRTIIPDTVRPQVNGDEGSATLVFMWVTPSEERESTPESVKLYPTEITRELRVHLVCEDGWKVDSEITERTDRRTTNKPGDKTGEMKWHMKFPSDGRGHNNSLKADVADAPRP